MGKERIKSALCCLAAVLMVGCRAHEEAHQQEKEEEMHEGEIVLSAHQAEEAGVQIDTVRKHAFQSVIKVGGEIVSAMGEEAVVVAPTSGILHYRKDNITVGSSVGRGEKLADVSGKEMVDGDSMEKARIAYKAAQKEMERATDLVSDRIISQKEYEQRKMAFDLARAAYEKQSKHVTAAGVGLQSPMKGWVKELLKKQGDYVEKGEAVAVVTQQGKLQLRAEVPEKYAPCLPRIVGANFKLNYSPKVYALSQYHGRLLSYAKSVEASTYMLPVIFEFDNVGGAVRGAYAEVYLLVAPQHEVLTIPLSALTEEQGLYYVYCPIEEEANTFVKREVEIGADDGLQVVVRKGLAKGDPVVVKGTYQVKLAGQSGRIPEGHNHNH